MIFNYLVNYPFNSKVIYHRRAFTDDKRSQGDVNKPIAESWDKITDFYMYCYKTGTKVVIAIYSMTVMLEMTVSASVCKERWVYINFDII